MKVYAVVEYYEDGGYEVLEIFSTKSLAEGYINKLKDNRYNRVIEFNVDNAVDANWHAVWTVNLNVKTGFISCDGSVEKLVNADKPMIKYEGDVIKVSSTVSYEHAVLIAIEEKKRLLEKGTEV